MLLGNEKAKLEAPWKGLRVPEDAVDLFRQSKRRKLKGQAICVVPSEPAKPVVAHAKTPQARIGAKLPHLPCSALPDETISIRRVVDRHDNLGGLLTGPARKPDAEGSHPERKNLVD